MTPSRAFWGIFFVALGSFYLLREGFGLDLEVGDTLRFWPLLLVLIGLMVMFKTPRLRAVLAGLAALVLSVLLYNLVTLGWVDALRFRDGAAVGKAGEVQEFIEPLPPNVARATLVLAAAAGRFTLDTAQGQLLVARIQTGVGRYTVEREMTDQGIRVRVKPATRVHLQSLNVRDALVVGDIRLSTVPRWDVKCDVDAASLDCDLRPFSVESLSLKAGAASVRVYLGVPEHETRCRIEMGVSTLKLYVPESVGCEVKLESGLSSKRFVDFTKVNDRIHRTENFDHASTKTFFTIKAGLSTILIDRY